MKLGAHLSISGGYTNALHKIAEIGGNCLQIFSASPRGWNFPKGEKGEVDAFVKLKHELKIGPVFFHASYLINLADPDKTGHLSKQMLVSELSLAPRMEVEGSVIHIGSYKDRDPVEGYKKLIANCREVLKKIPAGAKFIIENSATRKIGQSMDEIARMVQDLDDDRVCVCLDTCHLHAAGHDLSAPEKLDAFLKNFDRQIGLNKLVVWHINDSRDPFGSMRDRHENIGEGQIDRNVFKLLLNHPKMNRLPFIAETPGFDDMGPDRKNLDILKKMAS